MFLTTRFTFGTHLLEAYVPGAFISLAHLNRQDRVYTFTSPVFEVNGETRGNFLFHHVTGQRTHKGGWEDLQLGFTSVGDPDLYLRITFRSYYNSEILRMRFRLTASAPCQLTRASGQDHLTYFGLKLPPGLVEGLSEVTFSQYEPVLHSYLPGVEYYPLEDTFAGQVFPGPLLLLDSPESSFLVAYEHGADYPDSFLAYTLADDENGGRQILLNARKGNYFHGQEIGPDHAFESVWFEVGLIEGELGDLLQRYRSFLHHEMSMNVASRRPFIAYNTWNFQERNRLYHGRPYLESMNQERILKEIDVAHRLGIETFVIDTGWFDRPGDWNVNLTRFPDGLKEVKRRLDDYGMQLGLWFNPQAVGVRSGIFSEHPEYEMTWQGKPRDHWVVWETEESAAFCLASDYADTFARVMLRFREELGVTYFKWDGLGQFGCDSPHHHHGNEKNAPQERADCYAYQMGLHLIQIAEKVTSLYPDVVVDFDVTECGRFMGLGFLSVGRYFLINNGSYARDFDTPEALGINPWMNMFFYPGAARARVCRRNALYDLLAPANLFMVHYLPDGPQLSLENNLASLVLGGNALWGDLLSLSDDEIAFWAQALADYRRVRQATAQAYSLTRGFIGASPEIHEKIDAEAGCGLVTFFTTTPGEFTHLTQTLNLEKLGEVKGADAWEMTHDGRLKLTVQLGRDGARTVFLLPKESIDGQGG